MSDRPRTMTLIRHAPTVHNASGIISGRLDAELSVQGRDFATAYVTANGHLSAALVIASPLRRAFDTARILFEPHESRIVTDERCVERSYGAMEGALPADVAAMNVSYVDVGGIQHSLNPPGGESLDELRDRADRFLRVLLEVPDEHVACVSHQVFLQQLHGAIRGLSTVESLAIDIRPLGIHRYALNGTSPAEMSEVFAGDRHIASW